MQSLSRKQVTPNLLHFVWFGRDLTAVVTPKREGIVHREKEKPGGHIDGLVRWAQSNPRYQVILWTDSSSEASVRTKIDERRKAGEEIPPIAIMNFDDYFFQIENSKEYLGIIEILRNPTNYGELLHNMKEKTELSKGKLEYCANYAAASDIARCIILKYFGGIYMDLDTQPRYDKSNVVPLPPVDKMLKGTKIRIGLGNENEVLVGDRLTNDVIVCRSMTIELDEYLSNYLNRVSDLPTLLPHIVSPPIEGQQFEFRMTSTEYLGPAALREIIVSKAKSTLTLDQQERIFPQHALLFAEENKRLAERQAKFFEAYIFPQNLYQSGLDHDWFYDHRLDGLKVPKKDDSMQGITPLSLGDGEISVVSPSLSSSSPSTTSSSSSSDSNSLQDSTTLTPEQVKEHLQQIGERMIASKLETIEPSIEPSRSSSSSFSSLPAEEDISLGEDDTTPLLRRSVGLNSSPSFSSSSSSSSTYPSSATTSFTRISPPSFRVTNLVHLMRMEEKLIEKILKKKDEGRDGELIREIEERENTLQAIEGSMEEKLKILSLPTSLGERAVLQQKPKRILQIRIERISNFLYSSTSHSSFSTSSSSSSSSSSSRDSLSSTSSTPSGSFVTITPPHHRVLLHHILILFLFQK